MPIVAPGKRPSPRLAASKVFGKKGGFRGKHGGYASLQLTPMVDMFTIIVIYLLANFSDNGDILFMSKEIQLPNITSKISLQRAPVISISASAISVDGTKVLDTDDLTKDTTLNVPALEDVMREKKKNIEQSAALMGQAGAGFKGIVNFQVDKGIKFQILKKVMFAVNVAGFGNINFAGMMTTAGATPPKTAANP
jgi:biopolymer transport protein ExbD